jgi:uncharacterized coiled-coil protein SlyX
MDTERLGKLERRVERIEQCIRELCLVLSERDPMLWEHMQKLINTLPGDNNAKKDPD